MHATMNAVMSFCERRSEIWQNFCRGFQEPFRDLPPGQVHIAFLAIEGIAGVVIAALTDHGKDDILLSAIIGGLGTASLYIISTDPHRNRLSRICGRVSSLFAVNFATGCAGNLVGYMLFGRSSIQDRRPPLILKQQQ